MERVEELERKVWGRDAKRKGKDKTEERLRLKVEGIQGKMEVV